MNQWTSILGLALLLVGCGGTNEPSVAKTEGQPVAEMRPIDTLDSVGMECQRIRNNVFALVSEYKAASEARRSEILSELEALGRAWNDEGCRSRYGNVTSLTAETSSQVTKALKMNAK